MYNAKLKQPLFDQFYWVWGPRYQKLKMALDYIYTYPNLHHNSYMPRFFKSSELDCSQTEWIWLYHQLEHPAEKTFFKPWFVFVIAGEFDFFVDISDENLPLYFNTFRCNDPGFWLKAPIFKKISDYLLIPDDSTIKLLDNLKKSKSLVFDLSNDIFL